MEWNTSRRWIRQTLLAIGWLLLASIPASHCTAVAAANVPAPAAPQPIYHLFNAPEKVLVHAYCQTCHSLDWIERSGGNLAGWTSRLRRMNRAGAMIPPDKIPEIAAYLARALPERPRPEPAAPVTTNPVKEH